MLRRNPAYISSAIIPMIKDHIEWYKREDLIQSGKNNKKEYATFTFSGPRRCGHTEVAVQLLERYGNSILIYPFDKNRTNDIKRSMHKSFRERIISKKELENSHRGRSFSGKIVIIDLASIASRKTIETIYDLDPYFVIKIG